MSSRKASKSKSTDTSAEKARFERKDVVKLIGIPSPLMLVVDVSEEPDEHEEFTATVIYFNDKGESTNEYGEGQQYSEGLLQLVTPAAVVARQAAEETEKARQLAL